MSSGKLLLDAEDSCAHCGVRQNAASNMTNTVFQVNTDVKCGHKFCGVCLHDLFSNQGKRQFSCKRCASLGRQGMVVKKEKLSAKSLDETEVERDVRIRKRIKAIFNKTEENFATKMEYRNYDEEVEDIIYNLVHEIDVEETKARVEEYQKVNEEDIAHNQSKRVESESLLETQIRTQREEQIRKRDKAKEAAVAEKLKKIQQKKHANDVALDEVDSSAPNFSKLESSASSSSSSSFSSSAEMDVDGGNGAFMPSQLSQLSRILAQREQPKLLTLTSTKAGKLSNEQKRVVHAAGGFDQNDRWRRNWHEIMLCLEASCPLVVSRVPKKTWD